MVAQKRRKKKGDYNVKKLNFKEAGVTAISSSFKDAIVAPVRKSACSTTMS